MNFIYKITSLFAGLITMTLVLGVSWHYSNNFQIWQASDWNFLGQNFIMHLKDNWLLEWVFPREQMFGILGAVCAGVFVMVSLYSYSFRAGGKTIHGKHKSQSLHGDARWAEDKEVKRAGLLDQSDGGVVVGGFQGKQLIDRSGLHNLIFAPTGSGKGVGIVTPTMLRWDQSVIVLDIKRELYNQTAGYRASKGHRILPFDPTSEHSVRFNPLAEIRVGTKYAISDSQRLADVFINPSAIKGDNRYFANNAYTWVMVLFLHVVYKAYVEETEVPSMYDVYQFMNARDEMDEDEEPGAGFNELCQKMMDFDHGDKFVNKAVTARARQMQEMELKPRSSVVDSANEPFNLLFMDPMIIRNTSKSDFSIKDLMNGDQPSSLYLMFPPSDISRLESLFRVLIELFLAQTLGDLEFVRGQAQSSNKYKMLLLMDEFTSIGKLVSYEKGLAYMRGYGVKSMVIIQNNGQTNKLYEKDNAFMPNSDILTTYYSNHPETQSMISKMCGKTTIIQEKVSVSGKGWSDKSRTVSQSEVARDLILPDEVGMLKKTAKNYKGQMEAGENLVFVGGLPPIRNFMLPYFQDEELSARTRIPLPDLIIDDEVIPYKNTPKEEKES